MAMNPLAALLAAHAQSQGAPAGPTGPIPTDGDDAAPNELVSRASQLLSKAIGLEKDPVEREALSKIVALLHGFAAREQKQRDAAMGAGPAVQLLRRQQG